MDDNLQTESVRILKVTVDRASPPTPLSLLAAASSPSPWQSSAVYPLTWQHPPEVSGVGKSYVKVAGGTPAVLGPVTAHTVDLGANAAQGSTPVSVWLEDNVQNVDPNNAAVVELRHDSVAPAVAASAPTRAAAAPLAVTFTATEAGAGGQAPTASGVKKTTLWHRTIPAEATCATSPGPWTRGPESTGPGEGGAVFSGAVPFAPPADARYCFYVQAEDVAGNKIPDPTASIAAHGETLYDGTPPVLSDLRVADLSAKQASLAFASDEPATARVEWGLSSALGNARDLAEAQAFTPDFPGLPSAAVVYYRVTLTNRVGGTSASAVQTFSTPLDLAVAASIDNVIYPDQPIVIRLDNPGIGSAAYVIGGQAGTIPPNGSFSLFPPAVPGPATLTVTIDGATYSRAFIVDDPSRQYRIPRKVVAPGGEESSSAGSKILAAPGQPAATGAAPLASERSQLFLGFLAGIDPMAPGPIADLAAVPGPGRGQVTLSWKAVGDDAGVGRAMVYELRRSASPIVTEADFKNALVTALPVYPAQAGTSQSAVVSGLPDGAQLHFALKALDEARNASPLGRVASAATLAFTASAETVGGAAAFELLSSVAGITVRRVESPGTLPVLRAAAQGFTLGGPLFEVLSPLNPLPAPGALTMRYDPAAVGTAEALLKIYRFDSEAGAWELLADSRVEPDRDLVTATVGHFSYITLLAPDVEAPTTELLADTGRRHLAPDGQVFLSAAGRLSLSARDPPVGALPGTGVSRTESRLDGAAFSDYDAPFTLPEGLRTLEYRSFDLAGNTETLRSAVLRLDAAAPRFALSSPEPSLDAPGAFTLLSTRAADGGLPRLVVSVSDALTAAGAGPGAGVARASVSLDGAPYAAFEGSVTMRLTPGRHLLRVSAEDNVGNAVTGVELPVAAGDLAPPRVALRVGSPRVGDFVAAGTVLTWTAEDDLLAPGDALGAGAAFLSVLADGVPLAAARREPARGAALVATATLAGLADGPHSLSWSAHDAFGNVVLGTAALVLDSRGPAFLAVTPASGAFTAAAPVNLGVEFADAGVGVSSASAALAVDGLARAVAATTAAARAEAVLAQGPHAALWTAADLLGNAASTATAFTADRTAPLVTLVSPLGGERYVAGTGTIPVAFAVSDGLSASSAAAALAQLADQGSPRGARPALVAVSSGAALDPLALDDGLWELRVSAVDSAGNSTQAVSGPFEVLHDLRPPRTNLSAGTPIALVAGASVVARGTALTLASLDDMVGVGDALGLGVAAQRVSVDGIVRATFTAPTAGPGIAFISTFALASEGDGWHEVAYFATDVLGNIEASRVSTFGIDDTAPETSLAVLVGRQAAGPDALTFYASSGTNFALPAVDRAVNGVASGVDSTRWQDNGGTLTTYSTPFTLSEGPHLLAYQTQDRLGKLEVLRSTTVLIDANAPQSSSAFGLPTLVDTDGTRFVTPATTLSLSAQDPALPGGTAGSGVERIEISLDGAAFSTYTSPLTFAEGRHTVQFRAVDRVGNVEAAQTLSLRSDASAPQTALIAQGGRQAPGGTGFYASSDTRFALAAIDPLVADVAAGVDLTRWQDNGGAFEAFSAPFSLSEGSHFLGFQSQDRVSNLEAPRSSTVFVDATAPVSSYSIGDPLSTGVGAVKYITPATPVTFSAEDAALPGGTPGAGIDRIEVAIDGGAFATFSAALNFAEGRHTVLFRAVDRVGNVEATQALALRSDATAPETSLAVQGGKQVAGTAAATFYASSDTRFAFPATDPPAADVASGVDFTGYRDNGGHEQPYAAAFSLPEGPHSLSYQSRDRVSNLEAQRSTTVLVDATHPLSSFAIGTPAFVDQDGIRYIAPATPVSFTASDPALPGGAAGSGVERIEVAVDAGSFAAYSAPLSFAEGRHTVQFRAIDRVGNVETAHTLALRSDASAPLTSLRVKGGTQVSGPDAFSLYASSATQVVLTATDPTVADVASGVDFTRWQDNGGPFSTYSAPLALTEGAHLLAYQSRDRVENLEVPRSTTILLDATAPQSAFAIGTPAFTGSDGTRFISPETPVSFSALDPALPGGTAGSGVERIEVAVDGGAFAAYTVALTFPQGRHTVQFRAIDRVGNIEATQTLALRSDNSAPQTSLAVQGGRQVAGPTAGSFYASSDTRIGLPATDPTVADVASGVGFTRWQDSGGAFQAYSSPIALAEGSHLLAFQSQDHVANLEALKSTTVFVDASAPNSAFAIGAPSFVDGDGTRYVTPGTPVSLVAQDPGLPGGTAGSGVERIEVAVDGGAFAAYTAALTFPEGRHTVQFRAIDRVGNVEATQSLALRSDSSAPQTSLAAVGGRQAAGPDAAAFYASGDSRFVFPASDPVAADVASGVGFTRWQDGSGAFQTYSAPVALAEGPHLIAYQSQDRVANLEILRSTTVLVDSSAPKSAFAIGTPAFVAPDGARYVAPGTQVTLSASDPALPGGTAGSGVERIEVAVDGAAFALYTAALTFPEGRHTVQFRAVDRVGNSEAPQTLALRSDASAPLTSLAAQGGRQVAAPDASAFYASLDTRFALPAADPVVSDVAAGVDTTRWQANGGAFETYTAPLALAEGSHLLAYRSQDKVQNLEILRSTTVLIDATAPQTAFSIGAPSYTDAAGVHYVTPAAPITFTAQDPALPGGAAGSGVERIEVALDAAGFQTYSAAVTLEEGRHSIRFRAYDKVGNVAAERTLEVRSDASAPLSSLAVQGGRQTAGPDAASRYASADTRIVLSASDPLVAEVASGVDLIRWRDNGGAFQTYAAPIALAEGSHVLTYQGQDKVQNVETLRSTTVLVDATAPHAAFQIGTPAFIDPSGTRYITPTTPVTFTAEDPALPGGTAGSGVERIEVSVDGGGFVTYTAALTFPEGRHAVQFRAFDRVGNVEGAQTLALRSDASTPLTSLAIQGGRQAPGANATTFYASSATRYALPATDPVVADVASGVEFTRWQDNGGSVMSYTGPIAFPEGVHILTYASEDRVRNVEAQTAVTALVDAAPPITQFSLNGPRYAHAAGDQSVGGELFVSPTTGIDLLPLDPVSNGVASGLERLLASVDGGPFLPWMGAISFAQEGTHNVAYRGADRVGNEEGTRSVSVSVDATAPSTSLSFDGPALLRGPGATWEPQQAEAFITPVTKVILTTNDPTSAGIASGVKLTRLRIDSGPWQVYTGFFHLSNQGLHLVEFAAEDRVGNVETLVAKRIAVDNTAPTAGAAVNGPWLEAFGLNLLSTAATVSLAANDSPAAGVAVGLARILYRIDEGGLLEYTAPFALGPGSHTVRYHGVDLLGNAGSPQTLAVGVLRFLGGSLAATGFIDGSGTADVSGLIQTNGGLSLAGNFVATGGAEAFSVLLKGGAALTGPVTSAVRPLLSDWVDLPAIQAALTAANDNAALPAGTLSGGVLRLNSGQTVTLATGTYLLSGIDISGGAKVLTAGPVRIYVTGSVRLGGNSSLNEAGPARNLVIFGSGPSAELASAGASAIIYMPSAALSLSGGIRLGGSALAASMKVSGNSNATAPGLDTPAPAATSGGSGQGGKLAFASLGGGGGVAAVADASFVLREVYAFPNPAVGGARPTIHVAVGVADRVTIRIYDVAGQQVHQATLDSAPSVIDDGSGPKFAYELAWDGHIPSGVYLYTVVAEKGGQGAIRKGGKFAVVR